jgi:hypothetical protein
MNLDTKRSKRLDAYMVDPSHEVRDEKVRVMLAGEVHTLNVFRLPIDHLFYNIRNGRFASELLAKEEQIKRKLDAAVDTDAKIIKDLLLSQDRNETAALKQDLLLHGQIDPGIITFDGAIINANRRAAILTSCASTRRGCCASEECKSYRTPLRCAYAKRPLVPNQRAFNSGDVPFDFTQGRLY